MRENEITSTEEINSGHLLSFIERIERLEQDKQNITNDIKDVFLEAKGFGFDTKILRKVLKIRAQDRDELREEEEILSLYLQAIGISL